MFKKLNEYCGCGMCKKHIPYNLIVQTSADIKTRYQYNVAGDDGNEIVGKKVNAYFGCGVCKIISRWV